MWTCMLRSPILQAKVSGFGYNASQVWNGEVVVIEGQVPTFANLTV